MGNSTYKSTYTPSDADKARLKAENGMGWHSRGGWYKYFPGERIQTYFGKVEPGEAVRRLVAEQERRRRGELKAERAPAGLSVNDAVARFLAEQDRQLDSGAISPAQRESYQDELFRFRAVVGKRTPLSDFCRLDAPERLFRPLREAAVSRGMSAAEKHVTQVRTFLRWCSDVRRYIPAAFMADAFRSPSEKEKRSARKRQRREHGPGVWTPEEVRQIVDVAKAEDVHRYAQLLLALNGGMGSKDLSDLEDADVDWERACIHTDRSKTLVPRVIPLWSDTLAAMKSSRAARPDPAKPEWADRFFLTSRGRTIVTEELVEKNGKLRLRRTDSLKNWVFSLTHEDKAKRTSGRRWKHKRVRLLSLRRHRTGAYTFRAVFATLALGHGQDQNLEAIIMGQKFSRPVLEYYLRGELREKLSRIVEHVRVQLWPEG